MKEEEKSEELEELESLPELEEAQDESAEGLPKPQEITANRQKVNRRLPPILRLSRRTTIFLSLTLTAVILFFMTGNQQTFLDSNLKLILKIISVNAISLCFFAMASSLECIFYLIKERKIRFCVHLAVYLLIFIASLAISLISLSINLLSEGISF